MSGFLDREDFQHPCDDGIEVFDPLQEALDYELDDDASDEEIDEVFRKYG